MGKRTIVRRPSKNKEPHRDQTSLAASPKDEQEKVWQQMYIISERWKSDILFVSDELDFLRKLIDKYFLSLIENDNIERTKTLSNDLLKFDKKNISANMRLSQHLSHLADLIRNPCSHDSHECMNEHAQLETMLSDNVKEFRRIKAEVFSFCEKVIESDKAKRVLNGS